MPDGTTLRFKCHNFLQKSRALNFWKKCTRLVDYETFNVRFKIARVIFYFSTYCGATFYSNIMISLRIVALHNQMTVAYKKEEVSIKK